MSEFVKMTAKVFLSVLVSAKFAKKIFIAVTCDQDADEDSRQQQSNRLHPTTNIQPQIINTWVVPDKGPLNGCVCVFDGFT